MKYISIPSEKLPALDQETNIKLVTDILDHMYNHDNVGAKKTNFNGWQSRYTDTLNVSPEIMQHVDDKIFEFVKLWISKQEPRLELYTTCFGWFNVNFKNDYNAVHNHVNVNHDIPANQLINTNQAQEESRSPLISGCYYIQVPEGEENSFYFMPEYDNLNLWFKKDYREFINTHTGDINLFWPHIRHGVNPSKSDQPRITYAFNIHVSTKI